MPKFDVNPSDTHIEVSTAEDTEYHATSGRNEQMEDVREAVQYMKQLTQERATTTGQELDMDTMIGEIKQQVSEYVAEDKEGLQQVQFGLLIHEEGRVAYLDKGEVRDVVIEDEAQVAEVLSQIKDRDEQEGLTYDSYALRSALLVEAHGHDKAMTTSDAYTFGHLPKNGDNLKSYLDDEQHWLPERIEVHHTIMEGHLNRMVELHEKIAEHTGGVGMNYYLRGNTAAGKTTAVRHNEKLRHLLEDDEPSGVKNIDEYKGQLKQHEKDTHDGRKVAANQQVHHEGSAIGRKIEVALEDVLGSEANIAVDGRLAQTHDIKELIERADEHDKLVTILDIHVPLMLSCLRVLGREVNGKDPNTPYEAVAGGYSQTTMNRQDMIALLSTHPRANYTLLVAEDIDGATSEYDMHEVAGGLKEIISTSNDQAEVDREIAEVAETVITEEFIAHVETRMGKYGEQIIATLREFDGCTIEQAMDIRARMLE